MEIYLFLSSKNVMEWCKFVQIISNKFAFFLLFHIVLSVPFLAYFLVLGFSLFYHNTLVYGTRKKRQEDTYGEVRYS